MYICVIYRLLFHKLINYYYYSISLLRLITSYFAFGVNIGTTIAKNTYMEIIGANPLTPINTTNTALAKINTYLNLFSLNPKLLNFKLNIGISHISNQLVNAISNITDTNENILNSSVMILSCCPTTKLPQNSAFAGVGIPINELVCLVSTLNFASLNPENTDMKNAMYGIYSATFPNDVG